MPFFQFVPTVAPEPDNSATSARLIVSPDCAKVLAEKAPAISATPADAKRFLIPSSPTL
jgi:hypothetical protein